MRRFTIGTCAWVTLLAAAQPASATALVADLSHHLVAITTAFAGSDVLLFGTVGDARRDVIVTVRGPAQDTAVRRRTRLGFMWLNSQEVVFAAAPAFYAVAATGPLDAIADPRELQRHEIGTNRLVLEASSIEGVGDRQLPVFKDALIRRKERAGLYAGELGPILFIGGGLFRTVLSFPANVPPGSYQVQVFELENQAIVGAQTSTLVISKVGLEADLFDLAHRNAILYAGLTLGMALLAGWSAAVVFKKS